MNDQENHEREHLEENYEEALKSSSKEALLLLEIYEMQTASEEIKDRIALMFDLKRKV
jgi:hypothetical protein